MDRWRLWLVQRRRGRRLWRFHRNDRANRDSPVCHVAALLEPAGLGNAAVCLDSPTSEGARWQGASEMEPDMRVARHARTHAVDLAWRSHCRVVRSAHPGLPRTAPPDMSRRGNRMGRRPTPRHNQSCSPATEPAVRQWWAPLAFLRRDSAFRWRHQIMYLYDQTYQTIPNGDIEIPTDL